MVNSQTVPKPANSQKKMVQFSKVPKPVSSQKKVSQFRKRWYNSEKDGTILKHSQNLSPVRKRWCNTQTEPKLSAVRKRYYNTQTGPKPVNSQKKMVQFSNRAKICQQNGAILKQNKPVTSQKKMLQYSNKAETCNQSEKDGTILKQGQNLSTGRKRWYNTQTEQPVTSQKKMVQYSNRAKTCQQSEKETRSQTCHKSKNTAKILEPNPVTSQKDSTILKHRQNLSTVRKSQNKTRTEPKPDYSQKKMVQYSNRVKNCHH